MEISHATCNTGHINKSFTHDSFSCLSSDWVLMSRESCIEDSRSSEPESMYNSMQYSSVSPASHQLDFVRVDKILFLNPWDVRVLLLK